MRQGALSVDKYKMDWAMHNPGSKLPGSGYFSRRSRNSGGSRRSWLGRRELLFGRRGSTGSSGRRSRDPWNSETGYMNLKSRGYGSNGNEPTRPLNAYGMEMPAREEMEQQKKQL